MATRKREALTRERILRAALDLVDHEGLEAISMRRVGEALGVEAMSLYNHVANKAAILDGIFEAVLAEMPPAKKAANRTWQTVLRERGHALRAVLRAHPNTLPLFATRPAVTLASLAHLEAGLAVLRRAGFSAPDALRAFQVLLAFAIGHAIATYAPADETAHPAYEDLSEADFPRVREMAGLLPGRDLEAEWEFGLEALLTGIEARRHNALVVGVV